MLVLSSLLPSVLFVCDDAAHFINYVWVHCCVLSTKAGSGPYLGLYLGCLYSAIFIYLFFLFMDLHVQGDYYLHKSSFRYLNTWSKVIETKKHRSSIINQDEGPAVLSPALGVCFWGPQPEVTGLFEGVHLARTDNNDTINITKEDYKQEVNIHIECIYKKLRKLLFHFSMFTNKAFINKFLSINSIMDYYFKTIKYWKSLIAMFWFCWNSTYLCF